MTRFARLDGNLNMIFSYSRKEAKHDGDIEIPTGYFSDAIKFSKNEDDIIVVTRDTLVEPEIIKIEFERLRTERNTLLTQSDRYATLDFPHSNLAVQQTWFDYRQALRDLPTVTEDPANPVWPTPPQ